MVRRSPFAAPGGGQSHRRSPHHHRPWKSGGKRRRRKREALIRTASPCPFVGARRDAEAGEGRAVVTLRAEAPNLQRVHPGNSEVPRRPGWVAPAKSLALLDSHL
jgi:hypothetical protein